MEFRDVVFTVYLANGLTHYGEKTLGIDQLEPAVLKYFNIGSEAQLGQVEQKLDSMFGKANARMYERVSSGSASQSA
jgi:hypothetical protein